MKDLQSRADILFCVLPSTPETFELIDAGFLRGCKKGVGIVNAGRGTLINDNDLLAALDDGQVSGAILDVFHSEPLSEDHGYWSHPKVLVTPHVAALTYPETGAEHVIASIEAIEHGETPPHLVDWERGY